ncbi:MAG: choline-sulfatase [Gaiellaceae bacterium]|nr:choline-sulfatase [Gaiellaceae bacterium]
MDDANKPNIVLVVADQLAAAALPAYGNRVALTPNLDRLAGEGVVFERAFCPSPLCVPSRSALMSGLLPSQTGAIDNAGELPAAVPTFAHRLRLHGYRTVLVGKMHFIGPDQLHGFEERPLTDVYPAGFDWVPDWRLADDERLPWYHDLRSVLQAGPVTATLQSDYDGDVVARTLDMIAADDGSRPLLLVASFTHPHDPYEIPREYWERYEGIEIDAPAFPEPQDDPSTRRLRTMLDSDRIPVSDEQLRAARRGYYGAMSLVDDHVGAILDALPGNTVVVVTSDHGDMLGERGLWYKMAPFEPSIRVPLLVHAPERLRPRRIAHPVSLLGLGSMLVELSEGAEPVIFSAERDVPLEYLAEGVRSPQVVLVRGSRKLVRTFGEPDLVYDVADDPGERAPLEDAALSAAADERWDLEALDRRVRSSQERRRLVADALGTGAITQWDIPGGYISTGDDFWTTIERARRA